MVGRSPLVWSSYDASLEQLVRRANAEQPGHLAPPFSRASGPHGLSPQDMSHVARYA
jgi:hypothetical protein